MSKHLELHENIRTLRSAGLTYTEISNELGVKIPKSSLSYICRDIILDDEQLARITQMSRDSLVWKRQKAIIANKKIFDSKLNEYRSRNRNMKDFMKSRRAKLVALAMLYLGEGAKWKSRRGLMLGSADPLIIKLYIRLIKDCFGISEDKMRGRVQHRADQNPVELIDYWSKITGIKPDNFYPSYVDKRTIGKPTLKSDYHGVCSVTCAGTNVQLELDQIVGIINEAVTGSSYNG